MKKRYASRPDAALAIQAKLNELTNELFGVIEHLNFSDTIEDVTEKYGADSLDVIEFIMMIEEEYELDLDDDKLEKLSTIGDLVEALIDRVAIFDPPKTVVASPGVQITPAPVVTYQTADLAPKSNLTSAPTATDAVGVLWMPSLEWHGRVFKVEGVTMAEAIEMMNEFAAKASKKRKTKMFKAVADDFQHSEFFVNVIDTDTFPQSTLDDPRYFNKDIMSLMESKMPQTRGLRPLYLAHNVIGVGTTVIYNKNWATTNFQDPSVITTLLQIQDRYEEKEVDDTDDYPYDSSDSWDD